MLQTWCLSYQMWHLIKLDPIDKQAVLLSPSTLIKQAKLMPMDRVLEAYHLFSAPPCLYRLYTLLDQKVVIIIRRIFLFLFFFLFLFLFLPFSFISLLIFLLLNFLLLFLFFLEFKGESALFEIEHNSILQQVTTTLLLQLD